MNEIDFSHIVPRNGSKNDAFEELCCQLAHHAYTNHKSFRRFRGAGGDGGVECIVEANDGAIIGVQSKYAYRIDSVLRYASNSIETALSVHPQISRYIVCIPFDLTGPTARRGRSGQEKFEEWKQTWETQRATSDRRLTVELWSEFDLRHRLLGSPALAAVSKYFFDHTILTLDWFITHVGRAVDIAGPRYTPDANVQTPVAGWLEIFGEPDKWRRHFESRLQEGVEKIRYDLDSMRSATPGRGSESTWSPGWPEKTCDQVRGAASAVDQFLWSCRRLASPIETSDRADVEQCRQLADSVLSELEGVERDVATDIDSNYFAGAADSPSFRHHMAERFGSLPAANLDGVRKMRSELQVLSDALSSPFCTLAFERAFVLSGNAGVGKTHAVCDAMEARSAQTAQTCVVFGHQFDGTRSLAANLAELLELPRESTLSEIVDLLDAAGQASGQILLLSVDAINDTRPWRYWSQNLQLLANEIRRRNYVRLCVTCRTTYMREITSTPLCLPVFEHQGLANVDRREVSRFLEHFGLQWDAVPSVPRELTNSLYLKLVCETAQANGYSSLPRGWHGIQQGLRAYLTHVEKQFSQEFGTSVDAALGTQCLVAVSTVIARSGAPAVSRGDAIEAVGRVTSRLGYSEPGKVLDWLVNTDLLLEDPAPKSAALVGESIIRQAFERIGDFLVAKGALEESSPSGRRHPGELRQLWKDEVTAQKNRGVLSALSVLIPAAHSGTELVDLVQDETVRRIVLEEAIKALQSRDGAQFDAATERMILRGLSTEDLAFDTMEAIVGNCWQPSRLDAQWLDSFLRRRSMADRDALWCGHLHESFDQQGSAYCLIESSEWQDLARVTPEVALRWVEVLLWFTAAADGRVRDGATRGATRLLRAHPDLIRDVVRRFLSCDDDVVLGRALLSSYGALLLRQDGTRASAVADDLRAAFLGDPRSFDNAVIRDTMRCVAELAVRLGNSAHPTDPCFAMVPCSTDWRRDTASKDELKDSALWQYFQPNEFVSDFYKYSMFALNGWEHGMPKEDMGLWILNRICRDMGYDASDCVQYDRYIVGKYGYGRAKPVWAERIGKKYQWIGLQQLASRLHDHVERKRDSWEVPTDTEPLILGRGRQLDPTIEITPRHDRTGEGLKLELEADLDEGRQLSDADWVVRPKDLPDLADLVVFSGADGREWRALVRHNSWDGKTSEGSEVGGPRRAWTQLRAYLVDNEDFEVAMAFLRGKNFWGRWMPEGSDMVDGFVAEYPWGPTFAELHGPEQYRAGKGRDAPVSFTPCWNYLLGEWEYDATIEHSKRVTVPCHEIFLLKDLWWNGRNGYVRTDGRMVFVDPFAMEGGSMMLLADLEDLVSRVARMGKRVIWTLLGEKFIFEGMQRHEERTFSQIAFLETDGSLRVEDRIFFDQY